MRFVELLGLLFTIQHSESDFQLRVAVLIEKVSLARVVLMILPCLFCYVLVS
jgi:hypothetical protein